MAKSDIRIIKSKTCRQLAEMVKNQCADDYTELACAALAEILNDEDITESPENMTVRSESDEVIFDLVYLAERLVRAVGESISRHISHIGDEIAETVEC